MLLGVRGPHLLSLSAWGKPQGMLAVAACVVWLVVAGAATGTPVCSGCMSIGLTCAHSARLDSVCCRQEAERLFRPVRVSPCGPRHETVAAWRALSTAAPAALVQAGGGGGGGASLAAWHT